MARHVRQYCKIANSEEGMEKLFEHTLEQQVAALSAQVAAQNTQVAAQRTQMAEIASLLKGQLAPTPAAEGAAKAPAERLPLTAATIYAGRVGCAVTQNVAQQTMLSVTNIVQLAPWDGGRLAVSAAQMAAAFAENGRLKEYARLPVEELTDPEIAPPYVTELFMDLTRRAHADPSARNVYLNPRRADQALVHMASGRWEVVPLGEATRLMLDGVAGSIHKVARTWAELKQLPLEAQNALGLAGMVYEDEPEEYARRAKAPMSAHLANMAPRLLGQ